MVTLTETAAKKIVDLRLEEAKPEWGLRVRVVGGAAPECPTSSGGKTRRPKGTT